MNYYILSGIILIIIILIKIKYKKQNNSLTKSISNGLLTIKVNQTKYAGAVESIVFRGKELVNSHDHGRLFQTALQIDGYGECCNPTEAGSHLGSDSILKGINSDQLSISTSTQAASWVIDPNGINYCPKGKFPGITKPSNTIISKKIAINENIITWDIAINSPSAKETMNIEVLTGYLTADFTRAFHLNVKKKNISEINTWDSLNSQVDGYPDGGTFKASGYPEDNPIIFSTQDGSTAVGVYRISPIKKNEINVYHLFKFKLDDGVSYNSNSCSKFSIVSSGNIKTLTNNPSFQVKLIFGTLDEVFNKIKTF